LIDSSHNKWINGFRIKNIKYITVAACPIIIYGASTGRAPIQVRIAHDPTIIQNIN